jgi:hypothetical protein
MYYEFVALAAVFASTSLTDEVTVGEATITVLQGYYAGY